jgi:hypothetical protein
MHNLSQLPAHKQLALFRANAVTMFEDPMENAGMPMLSMMKAQLGYTALSLLRWWIPWPGQIS